METREMKSKDNLDPLNIINVRRAEDSFERKFVFESKVSGSINDIVLIENESNLGFAAGNNAALDFTLEEGYEYAMLLNNDTTVEPNSIKMLMNFMESNSHYQVCTPKINYYDEPEYIWNCGGYLTWTGGRKYLFKDELSLKHPRGYKDITFITGCALMARSTVFKTYGLLSERFFLGEEDYELSLRMKKNNVRMAAVLDTKIYHKVGRSKSRVFFNNDLPNAFIHHLNRSIDLKVHYNRFYWHIWRIGFVVYIVLFLKMKYSLPFKVLMKYIYLLFSYSSKNDTVSKELYFYMKEVFA